MQYQVSKKDKKIIGTITLDSSKSISNRVLIIQALCKEKFVIHRLSTAKDTQTLHRLLLQEDSIYDVGPAGTTFRFLTAFLATQNGKQTLTGSERMKQRPIGDLVTALNLLGASIEYLEKEGYPPLSIATPNAIGENNQLSIAASVSSQFVSALLLIAPSLPSGLVLTLEGDIVSRSYIEMTLALMAYFGIAYQWNKNVIHIAPQNYVARDFTVEADWSAASYYYAMAVFSDDLDLQLNGLYDNSSQGDAAIVRMMESFGVQTIYNEHGVRLIKKGDIADTFEWDYLLCPDIAQTLAVICAGTGTQGLFTGLETLKVKETDRVLALQTELAKVQAYFSPLPKRFSQKSTLQYYMIDGKATWENEVFFPTYEDHRMAMAFAPLAMFGTVIIKEPNVVEKSYPKFWDDIQQLGFEII